MVKWLNLGSLRRRLIWAVIVALTAVLLLIGVAIQSAIEHSSAREFDERLSQQARVIIAYANHEFAETGTVVPEVDSAPGENLDHEVVYQVWTQDGAAIHLSAGAPAAPLAALGRRGFTDIEFKGATWRVFALFTEDTRLTVQIAELEAHRGLIAARARAAGRIPAIASVPLLALLVWWLTTAALRPLERLADEIRARPISDMEPVDESRLPEELRGLIEALNVLIRRHGDALVREQRFTADAAHELRTPLAAVRAQAQVATRAVDPSERDHALQQLIGGVDRAGRLVTQLLSLARLEPANLHTAIQTRNVGDVLTDVLHDLQHDVERHGVVIDVVRSTITSTVLEEPVYLLLRNLIDNAVRHSPMGGRVQITLSENPAGLEISVSDQGPGIPAALRAAALDRFRRFTDAYSGSGLGLSIVKRVVELLHGQLALEEADPAPGLRVVVKMPLRR